MKREMQAAANRCCGFVGEGGLGSGCSQRRLPEVVVMEDGTLFNNIIRHQAYALPAPAGSILHEGIIHEENPAPERMRSWPGWNIGIGLQSM